MDSLEPLEFFTKIQTISRIKTKVISDTILVKLEACPTFSIREKQFCSEWNCLKNLHDTVQEFQLLSNFHVPSIFFEVPDECFL